MNGDSSAGSDGLSVPFYKVFWYKIKHILLKTFNEAIQKGELSSSQKRGIITLLHKGDNRKNLSNWRPISLLNTDYKIFSKVISFRIKNVLPKIISKSQKGFLKDRNITELIRNIDDIINSTYLSSSTGLLASVDFKKAFDSLSKTSIINSLKLFNFGPYLIKLVAVLMCNSESCVKNAGWLSSWFPCERGVRQGCSSSPYLFIIVAELMSIKIRSASILHDFIIPPNNTTIPRILQYADDTTLFIKSESDLESALNIIDSFGNVSGLKLNRKKSVILPIGGFERDYFSTSNVRWLKNDEYIKIAGIYFGAKQEASKIDLNWKSKIEDIMKVIKAWSHRHISLYGKIIICKTYLLSKINYIIQSLSLPSAVLDEIDRILFKFIWQKKFSNKKTFEKVKRSVMCKKFSEGGLNMVSVKDQQIAFQLKWIKVLARDSQKNNFAHYYLDKLGGIHYLLHCSSSVDDKFLEDNIKSTFWTDIIKSWFHWKPKIENSVVSTVDILCQPIFLNSNIRYKNRSLYIKQFIRGGLLFLYDLIQNKQLGNLNDVQQRLNKYPGLVFDYYAIINAIPERWKLKLSMIKDEEINEAKSRTINFPEITAQLFKKNNKDIRNIVIDSKNSIPCSQNFWKRKLDTDISMHYDIAISTTSETRLRVLHFKILHNIYPTNIMLQKMKIKENNLCETCQVKDYIEHFFVDCNLLKGFWSFISNKILIEMDTRINLTKNNIIFGVTKQDFNRVSSSCLKFINYILLIGKMCISKFKYGKIKNIYLVFDYEWRLRRNQIPGCMQT